jgi:hypothetical protein
MLTGNPRWPKASCWRRFARRGDSPCGADIAPHIVAEAMLAEVACDRPGGQPELPGAVAQCRPRQ